MNYYDELKNYILDDLILLNCPPICDDCNQEYLNGWTQCLKNLHDYIRNLEDNGKQKS